jgi:2-keto-4-pentenoate hydratase
MKNREIAEQLVEARLRAQALQTFPLALPDSLDAAYAIQDRAITLWPDRLVGWKVGRIGAPWLDRLGEDRLVGPIFERGLRQAVPDRIVEFPIFEGGFAAVEAEFVIRLSEDPPRDKINWTLSEARELPCALHVGIETAGSPIAAINDLGPVAVVSDFGNNAGLLLGPQISRWRERDLASLTCQTLIEDRPVGHGGALSVPGGPLAALAFALQRCAMRGRPLIMGDLVSTGATTGIHRIRGGERACVRFDGIAELQCVAVPASASSHRNF